MKTDPIFKEQWEIKDGLALNAITTCVVSSIA